MAHRSGRVGGVVGLSSSTGARLARRAFSDDSWMTVIEWIAAALGLVIVLSTLMSVVTSLVLPRLASSRIQLYVGLGMIKLFSRTSHRFETYEARDRFLALQAPLYLIVILATWLTALLIGFGLLLWPFMRTGGLLHALTVSGSSHIHAGVRRPARRCAAAHRVLRRSCRADDRRAADRVPAGALRRVQPARGAGDHARQPRRIARVGTGVARSK